MFSLPSYKLKKIDKVNLLKLAHKAIYKSEFPSYLRGFKLYEPQRNTRRSTDMTFDVVVSGKLFVGKASRLLNDLPLKIREEGNYKLFCNKLKKFLLDKSLAVYYENH